jgi:WD40 repeat protein
MGETPDAKEYVGRFPWLADRLATQFALQRLFQSGGAPALAGPEPARTERASAPPGYEIEAKVGRGAMGVVYRARQTALNRVVALKLVLADTPSGGDQLARAFIEAEAVARLQHPNVIQIFEVGQHGDYPFLSLEYVEGGSLADVFARGLQPPSDVVRTVETLARAIHEVHRHGIVHRDLKPANILLTTDGVLKIADFGLAKLLEHNTRNTDSNAILGTPSYIAPEQISGKSGRVGPACDIYALGAILYEGLTGRPPFKAETTLETLAQVGLSDPIAPTRLRPRLSRDLEAVCLKCLEKDPRRRYASATHLAEDLRRFIELRPTLARPIGVYGRCLTWARRQPVLAALLTSLAFVTALGLTGITWKWREAEGVRAGLEHSLYLNRIALAERSLSLNNRGRAERLLSECLPEQRLWEWHYLKRLTHADGRNFSANDQTIECLAFSPLGRELATGGNDGVVRVWDLETGSELRRTHGRTKRIRSLAYSVDGRWITTGSDDPAAVIWDARTGDEVHRIMGFAGWVSGLAFSPDGSRLAVACSQSKVSFWSTADWKDVYTLPLTVGTITKAITYSPDGRLVASAHGDATVRLWDGVNYREIGALRGHALPVVFSVAFSRDGRRLASCSGDIAFCTSGEAKIWDLDTGRELFTLQGHTGPVSELAFSPDGRRLATSSWDKTVKLWDTGTGEEVLTIRDEIDRLYCVAFSPDGQMIASVGNRGVVQIYDATPRLERIITRPRLRLEGADCVAFTPDCRRIISGGPGMTVRVCDASRGAIVSTLKGHTRAVTAVTCTQDGRQIISAGADGTIRLWDSSTGSTNAILTGHEDCVNALALRPGAPEFASCSGDKTIRRWDLATYRQVSSLRVHEWAVYAVAYSPDGRVIASASEDRSLKISDAETGQVLRVVWRNSDRITGLSFHPDGRRVAALCGLEGTAKVFDITTGQEVKTLRGASGVNLAFSHDGSRLVCASSLRDARVWNTATWAEDCIFRALGGEIRSAQFSLDDRHVATASYDGAVMLWDVPEFVGNDRR